MAQVTITFHRLTSANRENVAAIQKTQTIAHHLGAAKNLP